MQDSFSEARKPFKQNRDRMNRKSEKLKGCRKVNQWNINFKDLSLRLICNYKNASRIFEEVVFLKEKSSKT